MKQITAHLITIGDEILYGQTIDSNSAFIAKKLNQLGIQVVEISSIADDEEAITFALKRASEHADIVLTTGGLGPTKDDITKTTLASFFGVEMVRNSEAVAHIEDLFHNKLKRMPNQLNYDQALLPIGTEPLANLVGTAPGMWTAFQGKIYISLPGVPFEMKGLIKHEVVPKLKEFFDTPYIIHRNIYLKNIPESELAMLIEPFELQLPPHIKLAYLPTGRRIRLRLTAKGHDKQALEDALSVEVANVLPIVNEFVYSLKDEPLECIVGKILKDKSWTLAVAESFTSGRVASQITQCAGSSAYFKGGVVTYQTAMKETILQVPKELIAEYTVVSAQVAEAMANGVRNIMHSEIGIATTGVAGPQTDEFDNELGRAFIAIVGSEKSWVKEYYYPHLEREEFSNQLTRIAIELLYDFLH